MAKNITSRDFAQKDLICDCYDYRKYMVPFWKSNIIYNEVVFPITEKDGSVAPFSLLYDASEIISVKDYTLRETYEEGRDYVLEAGRLKVIPEGKINVVDYEYMHPSDNPDNLPFDIRYPHRDGVGFEYWDEGKEISRYCLAVTYIHNDLWHSVTPPSIARDIPKAVEKLKAKEDFTFVVLGDSVSAGAKSSYCSHLPPHADAYPEMLAKQLEYRFDATVNLINKAVGGTLSTPEYENIRARVFEHKPDLVIIAYGMNDSSHPSGGTNEVFKQNFIDHINFIRGEFPDCEFILVASVYGNTETFSAERYEGHARMLHQVAAEYEGVAVCDPQAIEQPLFESGRKRFLDFMADNMVHPNDFGMRLIAQTIFDAIED